MNNETIYYNNNCLNLLRHTDSLQRRATTRRLAISRTWYWDNCSANWLISPTPQRLEVKDETPETIGLVYS